MQVILLGKTADTIPTVWTVNLIIMVIFRADGSAQIGSGHIMRCLSIADAFKRKNIDCEFVLADKSFQPLIEDRGYFVHVLETDYRDMDSEWDCLQKVMATYCPELVIVDSYFVTKSYLQRLKDQFRLAYIDDLAAFAYPVDVLLNYNAYGPELDYKKLYNDEETACPQLLLGVTYAPLREMFRNVPKHEQKETVENVLVSTGGSDLLHLALTMAVAVAEQGSVFKYHFLVGAMNEDYEQIKAVATNNKYIHAHHNVKDMKLLISSCDLVVSAAGSTMYEICACGVPIITYALADNQLLGIEAFEKLGLAVSCGDLRKKPLGKYQIGNGCNVKQDGICNVIDANNVLTGNASDILVEDAVDRAMSAISFLSNNFELRKKISEKMQCLVDGRGADRLVKELLSAN